LQTRATKMVAKMPTPTLMATLMATTWRKMSR
jgi:hypothetical protein